MKVSIETQGVQNNVGNKKKWEAGIKGLSHAMWGIQA